MSSNLVEFRTAEKSKRTSLDVEGRLSPRGSIGVDIGTSGTYRPIDADIETTDKGNASANVNVGGLAGGTFAHNPEDNPDGKGSKHRRGSSSSASSSSSSDEEGNEEKSSKAKRKKKKKRKGILSGNFLPKFGVSKKTKGKDDGKGRMASGNMEVEVSTSSKSERPLSTDMEIQADVEMDAKVQGNIDEGATVTDPDVEIFHGIGLGADDHTGTDHQCKDVDAQTGSLTGNLDHGSEGEPQSLGPLEVDVTCGSITPPGVKRVTVKASTVEMFPAPVLRSVNDDGTDVDLGLSAEMGGELDDSTSTSDLLSQIENTIQSIEAAQKQQSDAAVPDISTDVDQRVREGHGDVHLHSADIAAVNVDSDPTLHIHLAKPKDGPILELPEENQVVDAELNATDISIEQSLPNVSLQADLGTGRHSSTSSSRSSQGEQKQKSKGRFPIKFHMPKFGGKKSPKNEGINIDGNASVDLNGSMSVRPDLVTNAHNGENGIEAPQGNLDVSLPDLDKNNSGDISFNTSLNATGGSNVEVDDKLDPQVALSLGIESEVDGNNLVVPGKEDSDDDSDIDAYLGAAAIDVGLPVPVDMDFDASVDTPGAMEIEVSAKPKSKKTKRKLPKFKFGTKKAAKVDLPSGDISLDAEPLKIEGNVTVDAEIDTPKDGTDANFEVVGKRASLKRHLEVPDVETPVTPQLESNVESQPVDFEVNVNFSNPDVDIDLKGRSIDHDKGVELNGGLNEGGDVTLDSNDQFDWPKTKVDGDLPSEGTLKVECDLDVDESSDIEAYIGVSSPNETFPFGVTTVGPTIQGPDSGGKSSFQYNKGKMSKKGTRNLPKVKAKGSRNAFGGKAGGHDDRVDIKVDKKGPGRDFKMERPDLDVAVTADPNPRRSSGDIKASSSEPSLVFNDDSKTKRKGFTLPRLRMPKFKKGGRKPSKDKSVIDSSFDVGVEGTSTPRGKRSSSLPDIPYAADNGRGEYSSPYLDTNDKKKKRWSTGFKLPNFGLPKFGGKQRPHSDADKSGFDEIDVSVSNPVVSAGMAVDTLPDDVFHADGAEVTFPKSDVNFGNGVPDFGIDGDVDLPEGGVDVDQRGDAKGLDWPQHKNGEIDRNITIPNVELKDGNLDSPEVEMEVNLVEEVASAPIQVNKPDVDIETDISGGVQLELETPIRTGDKEHGGVNIDAELGGDVTFPKVGFTGRGGADSVSVTSSSSSSSSESEKSKTKKKRGLFGGIHLPKFKGKGSSKKNIGTGVSFDDEAMDVDMRGEINMDVVKPDVTIDQKEFKPEMDVDVSADAKIGGDLDFPQGDVGIDGNIKPPGFALSRQDLDLPDVSGRGNIEVDIDGKPDISGRLEVDTNLPEEDLNLAAAADVPSVDLDGDLSSDFNVPGGRVNIALDGDISVAKVGVDVDADLQKSEFDLPNLDIDVDGPSGDVEIDVKERPNAAGAIEGGINIPSKNFDIAGDVESPRVDVDVDAGGRGGIVLPAVGFKVRDSEDNKSVSSTSSSSSSSSDIASEKTNKKKKGLFGGFHFPKFKGKGSPKKTVEADISVDGIKDPSLKVDLGDVDIGTDVVVPDVNADQRQFKPTVDVDISMPDVSGTAASAGIALPLEDVEVEGSNENIKIDPDLDIPKVDLPSQDYGSGRGDLEIPSRDMEVGVNVNTDADIPDRLDTNVEVPHKDIELDIDTKGGIELPKFGVNVKGDGDNKSVTSSSSSSSSESEQTKKKKKKGFFGGIHLPKFRGKASPKKAVGTGVSFDDDNDLDLDTELPRGDIELSFEGDVTVPDVSIDQKALKPELDVSVKYPDVSVPEAAISASLPHGKTDVDLPDVSGKPGEDFNLPSGTIDGDADIDLNTDRDIPKPGVKISGSVDLPKGDGETDIQIPGIGGKFKVEGDNSSITSSSSSSSDGDKEKKKKGFFGSFNIPKFKGKGPGKKPLKVGASFDKGEPNLGEHGVDVSVGPDDDLPDVSAEVDIPAASAQIDIPTDEVKASLPGSSVDADAGITVSLPDIDLPDVKMDASGDADLPARDAVPHVDLEGDVNLPTAEGEIDVSGGIRIPRIGIKGGFEDDRKSISSTSSSSSSESEKKIKKKKGLFGGFNLPKFRGKGPKTKGLRAGGDIDSDFPDAKLDLDGGGDLAVGADVVTPHVDVDEKVLKPAIDVDIPTPDVGKPDVSADVSFPAAEVDVDVLPGDIEVETPDIDLPDVKGKVDGDLPIPEIRAGVSIDDRNPDIDLKGEILSPDLHGDFDAGGGISIPKLGAKDFNEDDKESVTSSSSSDSENEKKKKGFFGSLHLPKFKGRGSPSDKKLKMDIDIDVDGGGDVNIDRPEKPSLDEDHGGLSIGTKLSGDADLNVNIPKPSVESPDLDLGIGDRDMSVDVEKPDGTGDFEFSRQTPNLDFSGGTDWDSPRKEIGVDITIPNREVGGTKPSLDVKGENSIDINAPDVTTEVKLVARDPALDIPGDAKFGLTLPEGEVSSEGEVKVPDFNAGIPKKEAKNVRFPDVDLVVKDDDSSSTTSSSSSDSGEDDKKKKKGFFGSLHFPKFKGKGPKTKRGVEISGKGNIPLDLDKDVDVESDDHNLKVGVEIPEADGTLSPEIDVNVKVEKPDRPTLDEPSVNIDAGAGVDIKAPSLEIDDVNVGAGPDLKDSFNLPRADVDSDVNVDLSVPDVDATIGGAHDQGSLDVEGSVKIPVNLSGDANLSGPQVNVKPSFVTPDAKGGINVEVGTDDSDIPDVSDVSLDMDVKLRGGMNVDVDPSLPGGGLALPGVKTGMKTDDGTSSSSSSSSSEDDDIVKEPEDKKKKRKGFFPSFHLPKINLKRPKSPDKKKGRSAASVEVELKMDVDVPDTDVAGAVVTGPDLWDPEIGVSLQVDEPEVAVSAAKPDKPEVDLDFLGGPGVKFNVDADVGADVDVASNVDNNIEVHAAPQVSIDTSVPGGPQVEECDITFENFGKLLAETAEFDVSDSSSLEFDPNEKGEDDVVGEVDLQADIKVNASRPERKLDLDVDWTQLGLEMSDDEKEPTADVNVGINLTRSSSKSSVSSSSSSEEEQKLKKTKGFLPSLKLPKFTGGKGQEKPEGPTVKVEGDVGGEMPVDIEGQVSPSLKVDVEASPPGGSPKGGKSPKGRLGLFRKGRGKKGDSPQSLQQEVAVPEVSVSLESTPQRPGSSSSGLHPPSSLSPPGSLDLSGAVATHSMPTTPLATSPSTPQSTQFSVVVAIDFGTTFSGYAYSFTKEPENVHVMRKWEGGDPGVVNMKTLTTLLMTPEGEYHSFGFAARDFYHDMKFTEAQRWLYFDKYKLALNDHKNLNIDTELKASNGTNVKALTVFEHTLRFFKDRFLEELMDLSMDDGPIDEGEIRWVLTVPAIWRQPAKQFMRQAAYKAGIASPSRPSQLMIALEPEAASIYIGKLSMRQLMPERMALRRERWLRGSMGKGNDPDLRVIEDMNQGSRYVVVDCGGGTVDITVHEVERETGTLKELHKASGGMFGSGNVDEAFIQLMVEIFGNDFIEEFKVKRPAGWVDLLIAFEARKRNANPWKANYLNVSLPFSFIDYYKKFTNGNLTVEQTLTECDNPDVKWCGQAPGMLRFSPEGMLKLFSPTTSQLLSMVDKVLAIPELDGITHLFLAGGFAESPLLQNQIRDRYKSALKVVIPQEVGLATMKGAVMFGQNPGAVSVRRTRLTYGVGALNKFDPTIHPEEKKIVKDGVEWCRDVFDVFVHGDQSVSAGERVTRSYAPASADQEAIKINVYCSENEDVRFITDDQVRRCGTLTIDLRGGKNKGPKNKGGANKRRELQLSMQFGDTEMRVDALDVSTGKKVEVRVDFLNN